jgi:hypothetical protein
MASSQVAPITRAREVAAQLTTAAESASSAADLLEGAARQVGNR